jgi:cell division transport system permease protein
MAALEGGIAGMAAAVTVIAVLGQQFGALGAGIVTGATLDWLDWIALGVIPLAGIGLAMVTARWTVLRALSRML